jgi:hypothetical protein
MIFLLAVICHKQLFECHMLGYLLTFVVEQIVFADNIISYIHRKLICYTKCVISKRIQNLIYFLLKSFLLF